MLIYVPREDIAEVWRPIIADTQVNWRVVTDADDVPIDGDDIAEVSVTPYGVLSAEIYGRWSMDLPGSTEQAARLLLAWMHGYEAGGDDANDKEP